MNNLNKMKNKYRVTNMWNIGKANNYMLKYNLFLLEINNNMYVT